MDKLNARIRTDNMSGTVEGKNLVSLKYEGAIENGNVLAIGAFIEGEREVRTGTAPQKNTPLRDLAVIATPEVIKSKTYHSLGEYINEEGTILRGYRLTPRDYFSVTKEAFDEGASAQLKVGGIVEVKAGSTKLNAVASATEETTTIGKIVLVEDEWYVIEVADCQ